MSPLELASISLDLNRNERPYVIAEVGFNHNGNLSTAKKLIQEIAAAGADCAKFQLYRPERLLSREVADEVYQIFVEHQFTKKQYQQLVSTGEKAGIAIGASVFDPQILHWYAENTEAPFIKIASGDITYKRLLEAAGQTELPVILSTGGATGAEIKRALGWLGDRTKVFLLHCLPEYPVPIEKLNLDRISHLNSKFQLPSGFSDHSKSTLAPLAAARAGACIWERHITLDQQQKGPEHSFSLPAEELAKIIKNFEKIDKILNERQEQARKMRDKPGEPLEKKWAKYRQNGRRSLAAKTELKAGEKLTASKLSELRPATGISAVEIDKYVNKKISQSLKKRELISPNHIRSGK